MIKEYKNQKGISLRGLCVVIVLLGIALGFLLPRYFGQFEKLRAMSMQAMLINVLIAEDLYREKNGVYTDRWNDLLPYVSQPESLEPQLKAVTNQAHTYFFGFGKNAARSQRGYWVSLQVKEDKKSGTITARRTPNGWYHYELNRAFPDGDATACIGGKMSGNFCKHFLTDVEGLEVKNLIPVPNQETQNTAESVAEENKK